MNLSLDVYENIARKIIYKFCKQKRLSYKQLSTNTDYLAPAIEALIRADNDWNPNKGASLSSFRYRGVILSILQQKNKNRRKISNLGKKDPVSKKDWFPVDLNKEIIEKLIKDTHLDEEEKELLQLRFYEGKKLREIGEKLNCSRENIRRRIDRILYRLKISAVLNGL